jgi:hypothetical protein
LSYGDEHADDATKEELNVQSTFERENEIVSTYLKISPLTQVKKL